MDMQVVSCHREPLVNLYFMRIENHGGDAGPSMTSVQYATDVPTTPRVQLTLSTPPVPSHGEILVAFALSYDRQHRLLVPVGRLRITLDENRKLADVARQHTVLVTGCNDLS